MRWWCGSGRPVVLVVTLVPPPSSRIESRIESARGPVGGSVPFSGGGSDDTLIGADGRRPPPLGNISGGGVPSPIKFCAYCWWRIVAAVFGRLFLEAARFARTMQQAAATTAQQQTTPTAEAMMMRREAFLACIASPEHKTTSRLRLVVGERKGAV